MKMNERVIRYCLIALILLSLYFSYNIWLSPIRPATPTTSDDVQVVADEESLRKESDTFLPLRLLWMRGESAQQTNGEVIATVQGEISNGHFGDLKEIVANNEKQFNSYLQLANGVELNYEGAFLISEYSRIFSLDFGRTNFEKIKDGYFTLIQLDFDEERIRFLDFDTFTIYEATMNVDQAEMTKILNDESIRYTAVDNQSLLSTNQYDTKSSIRLKKYSYLVVTQAYTLFRNNLFTNPDSVTSSTDSTDDLYRSGNEDLSIDKTAQIVQFRGSLSDEYENIYEQTFSYVSKFGNSLGNLRYFDRTDNQINYRVLVEGFPVFSSTMGLAQVNVAITSNSNSNETRVRLQTNSNTIQVPIPSDEEVELPSMNTVLQNLLKNGADEELVQSIIVGYTWQDIKGEKGIVNLTPEWYVCYKDVWYRVEQLIKELPTMEVS